MADFVSSGWGLYVAIATLVSIVFTFFLALAMSQKRAPGEDVETTGHVWDEDLAEYNNPLPRWWLYMFYIGCVFGLVYLILYPGLGAFKGQIGWTSQGQYEQEMAQAKEVYEPLFAKYLAQDIPTVAKDPQARAMGERLFLTYCAQCHGSDARGSKGFPNLSDNDWLGAGDPAYIKTTIMEGRTGVMPPMAAAVGAAADVENVANYVLSLSGSAPDAMKAALGKEKFAPCMACHGAGGVGNPAIGAPNLSDKTWLYGGSLATIVETITHGRTNQMPSFKDTVGESKAHVLAAYIWGLSHPQ